MLNILQLLPPTETSPHTFFIHHGCREKFRPDDQNFIPGVFWRDVFKTELKYSYSSPVHRGFWSRVDEWHKKIKFITL